MEKDYRWSRAYIVVDDLLAKHEHVLGGGNPLGSTSNGAGIFAGTVQGFKAWLTLLRSLPQNIDYLFWLIKHCVMPALDRTNCPGWVFFQFVVELPDRVGLPSRR